MPDNKDWIETVAALPSEKIMYAVTDIDGILRGKLISKRKLLKGLEEQLGFCNVIFGWDAADAVYDNATLSGWHTGYPDALATIDMTTLRNLPWNDNMPFVFADFSESNIAAACPRTLLKKIRQQCINKGFMPLFAKEFEWFNFRETPQGLQNKSYHSPQPFTTGMFGYSVLRLSQHQVYYNGLFDGLRAAGVPLEGLHTETGDGVSEAAIDYTDILEAGDRAVLFKTGVKEIAYQHGLMACFMAKWNNHFPGCSGHIHQSLWDKEENNLFYEEGEDNNMSALLKQYIAGQLYCLPHIMPMYAPTINSYKRYVEGAWSATSVSWGIENRTTALRVINHSHNSMRLETRVPGADANPYLALAASLASGLYGIENNLDLNIAATAGNEYENKAHTKLPKTLKDAVNAMKASPIANQLFGENFVDHFTKTREWECTQHEQAVTDWELKRYFEII